jgi:hypothetical protein
MVLEPTRRTEKNNRKKKKKIIGAKPDIFAQS